MNKYCCSPFITGKAKEIGLPDQISLEFLCAPHWTDEFPEGKLCLLFPSLKM